MGLHQLKKGPSLIATFVADRGVLITADLAPHAGKGMQWRLEGAATPQLEDILSSWIEAYIEKKNPKVRVPFSLESFPPYTTKVLQKLATIPFGQTLSYAELAEACGNSNAARATGSACGRNPLLLIIPCHRILGANGALGGFTAGLHLKKQLLDFEGISYI